MKTRPNNALQRTRRERRGWQSTRLAAAVAELGSFVLARNSDAANGGIKTKSRYRLAPIWSAEYAVSALQPTDPYESTSYVAAAKAASMSVSDFVR
jgi:hypothetical protein